MRDHVILNLSGLSVRRGGTVILQDVHWRVERGQHWAILGPNGSGKTSLLSALTGYLTPTSGRMELLGRCYGQSDWRDLRRRIGLVSSSIRQLMAEHETPLETIVSGKHAMIGLWANLTAADRARALGILRRVECAYAAERPWGVLSQGERQRVLIGRALMARPRVLILDEPCAGLDPVAREHFLQFLDRLGRHRAAPTLVLVTHHVEEIMPVFSHVMLLRAGRVMAAGRKNAVLTSAQLSAAFGAQLRLRRTSHRYRLSVAPEKRGIL